MVKKVLKTIGIVYEISENPLFNTKIHNPGDILSDFTLPSEMNNLIITIKSLGYKVVVIDGAKDLINRIKEIKSSCELIFNKSKGLIGLERKSFVPIICQLYDIPVIGTYAYNMALARHKFHCNRLLNGMNIRVPYSYYIPIDTDVKFEKSVFPLLLKPNSEGGSLGITEESIITDNTDLKIKAFDLITKFNQPLIAEEFIEGDEWKIPVIGNGSKTKSLGAVMVMKNGKSIAGSFQTRKDILSGNINYTRLNLTENLVSKALETSVLVHQKLELNDYSRIDFRLSRNNELVCMEVSTHPDLGVKSSFTLGAMQSHINYKSIINKIINSACQRHFLAQ